MQLTSHVKCNCCSAAMQLGVQVTAFSHLSLLQVSEAANLNFRPDLEASRKLVTIFLRGDDSVFAKSNVSK